MIIETQGCITVGDELINDSSFEVQLIPNHSYIEVTIIDVGETDTSSESSEVIVKPINDYIDIEIEDLNNTDTTITINPVKETYISCGLVCSPGIGLPVLYASDGVLITIEGQYLIVQRS